MNPTYLRFEMRRMFRNRQNFIFTLAFPLVLFYAIAGPNKDTDIVPGVTLARYYMGGMIAFGSLAAVFAGGARIAAEREIGWHRQLRITPLSPRSYLRTKVLTSYLMAIISLVLVSVAALTLGVSMSAGDWARVLGLALVALIPFTALGIFAGHLIKSDSIGPVVGVGISLFALLGGAYFPIGQGSGIGHQLVQLNPSYWLVQAGKTGVGGQSWTAEAWYVVLVWSLVTGLAAAWAYRRDTKRA